MTEQSGYAEGGFTDEAPECPCAGHVVQPGTLSIDLGSGSTAAALFNGIFAGTTAAASWTCSCGARHEFVGALPDQFECADCGYSGMLEEYEVADGER